MFNKKFSKKLLPVAIMSTVVFGSTAGTFGNEAGATPDTSNSEIKNVIFLIGDGMGTSYTSAYRYLMDDPSTPYTENTAFDEHLIGMQETYSWDEEESITDSAAAATSMAAGIKTYNNAIAVDMEKNEVKTALELAKEKGKSTGLVATSQVNHATPASFGAHDESRHNYNDIADDYFDETVNGEHKIDVILGGGTSYFEREDRNLTEEFQQDGFSYVDSREEMLNDDSEQVLGLFAPKGMDKMIDRTEDVPSLKEMTSSALDRLSKNKDGFFLMVEGSQIDWAGHDNDVVSAMSDMQDFEGAYQEAIEFAKKDKHTLVITTADHSTGGMAMGRDGEYKWDPEPIKAAKRTPDFMAAEIAEGADVEETLSSYIDLELTREEIQSVKDAADKGDTTEIDNAIEHIFDVRSGTGWTTGGHTGEDVIVYGYGPQSDQFAGLHDNHEIGQKVMAVLEGNRGTVKK
ncbi:alkaline phosphatase 3 [Thalassobacillus devorans]|uniref:Alkaline phosphatase 3 n=1 Tax=Thalassobacillus devorans TaxID=279813 RepID=A0ABQ1PF38_9BACI|nr:alkaline phosphatase [Thalassobacillus devorans]NIK29352.1 alkaline phosphatase [Thalassobacillus devorans]GGC95985.1 alkaline phosphatase 3 [Thalassobacillus devorans]